MTFRVFPYNHGNVPINIEPSIGLDRTMAQFPAVIMRAIFFIIKHNNFLRRLGALDVLITGRTRLVYTNR